MDPSCVLMEQMMLASARPLTSSTLRLSTPSSRMFTTWSGRSSLGSRLDRSTSVSTVVSSSMEAISAMSASSSGVSSAAFSAVASLSPMPSSAHCCHWASSSGVSSSGTKSSRLFSARQPPTSSSAQRQSDKALFNILPIMVFLLTQMGQIPSPGCSPTPYNPLLDSWAVRYGRVRIIARNMARLDSDAVYGTTAVVSSAFSPPS